MSTAITSQIWWLLLAAICLSSSTTTAHSEPPNQESKSIFLRRSNSMYVMEEDQDTHAQEYQDPITEIPGMFAKPDTTDSENEQIAGEHQPVINHVHVYVVKDKPQEPPVVDEAPPPQKKKPRVLLLVA